MCEIRGSKFGIHSGSFNVKLLFQGDITVKEASRIILNKEPVKCSEDIKFRHW